MAAIQEYSKIRPLYNGSAAYEIVEEPVWEEQESSDLSPKPHKAVKSSYGLSLFAVVGYFAVAVVMVLVLMTYVRYTAAAVEAVEYREQIETLTDDNRRLTILYAQTFDMNEVEYYARTVLGMDDPTENQTGVVSLNAGDKAVVYETEDGDTFLSGISAVVEYFR